MGLVPPRPGYLERLRELTEMDGALLVFDEVMTGFRLAFGGAQERFGVTPDMTALGKIIGGGLPAAAYGARAGVMEYISPVGPIYQAGTLSGNPLAMAAGLTTLRLLRDDPPYDRLETLTSRLEDGLRRVASDARVPHVVQRVGSMITLFFNPDPVHELRRRPAERHQALRPLLLGDAGARRVPAVQPVRSRLRLRRAHRGRHRPHDRRGKRGAKGDRGLICIPEHLCALAGSPFEISNSRSRIRDLGRVALVASSLPVVLPGAVAE